MKSLRDLWGDTIKYRNMYILGIPERGEGKQQQQIILITDFSSESSQITYLKSTLPKEKAVR